MFMSVVRHQQDDLVNDFQLSDPVGFPQGCGTEEGFEACPGHCVVCGVHVGECQGHSTNEWLRAALSWQKCHSPHTPRYALAIREISYLNTFEVLHGDFNGPADDLEVVGYAVYHPTEPIRFYGTPKQWLLSFVVDGLAYHHTTMELDSVRRYVRAVSDCLYAAANQPV